MAAASATLDMSQVPAGTPPAGVTPNLYNNPPSLQSTIIGFAALFYILTTITVSLRLYSVSRSLQKVAADDVLCILAVICTFAYMGFLIHLSYAARHMWDVPLSWLYSDQKYWRLRLAQNLFNPLAFFFSRAPVFVLYRRLFDAPLHRNFSKACWAGLIAAFVLYIHTFILTAVVCAPRAGHSYLDMDTFDRCSKALPDAIVQGAGNILLDAYALILPQPIIWKLKLSRQKRLNIALVFGVGSSCISMYYRVQLHVGSDTDWNEGAYDVTSILELNIAIICSCSPAVWRLLHGNNTRSAASRGIDSTPRRPPRFFFSSLTGSIAGLLGLSQNASKSGSSGGKSFGSSSSATPKDPFSQGSSDHSPEYIHSSSNLPKNAAHMEGYEMGQLHRNEMD
ncbi:hypothetical protein AbraCBS73388_007242 [Aspergillus brasiliensis]|uniref:Rhodopsin domain-containing protein n=1 Tax=Aspergillus brasiliensis TaxID=319629 RepID=A0A9W5YGQ3_9EURO|nr:hypothetical protein AbraCBS73388_007242 [Aspergillus brasiliensis]